MHNTNYASVMHRAPRTHSLSSQQYHTCAPGVGVRSPSAERSNAPTTSGGIVKGPGHSGTAPSLTEPASFQAHHMMSQFRSSVRAQESSFSYCCCFHSLRRLHRGYRRTVQLHPWKPRRLTLLIPDGELILRFLVLIDSTVGEQLRASKWFDWNGGGRRGRGGVYIQQWYAQGGIFWYRQKKNDDVLFAAGVAKVGPTTSSCSYLVTHTDVICLGIFISCQLLKSCHFFIMISNPRD